MVNFNMEMFLNTIYVLVFVFHVVSAVDHYLVPNYDLTPYKILNVNGTLELICNNYLNGNPPSWKYHSRMHNNPTVKFVTDIGESRMVISNAQAEDAGIYKCEIDHDYEGKTIYFNKEIEVIVNEIYKVEKVVTESGIKLLCIVHAYPTPDVFWKIDYDNKKLNPPTEPPDEYDDYWLPTKPKVVVDKSNGRFTLRQYNGVNNAELFIVNVSDNDNGNYYCVSRNIAGEQCRNFTVKVKRDAAKTGLGGGMIALIVVLSLLAIVVVGVVGLVIAKLYRRQKPRQKKEEHKEDLLTLFSEADKFEDGLSITSSLADKFEDGLSITSSGAEKCE